MSSVQMTVSIDTEEDNWGSFAESGATARNIGHLAELQDLLDRWGVRPTYFVNRPPLLEADALEVLGMLAEHAHVEIGGHCHPWNTPPSTGEGAHRSMMASLTVEANRGKIREVTELIERELGVRPRSFRSGRWGFGPTVSQALAQEGYVVDASVSPFIDWRDEGGPDFSNAPYRPYLFRPEAPLTPDLSGSMVEIPTTIGFLEGGHRFRASIRRFIEATPLRSLKAVAILDKLGLMRRRWLSPESSSAEEMIRLVDACIRSRRPVLDLTFHSCTLLPGATPYVRDRDDKRRFLHALEAVLRYCSEAGVVFGTMSQVSTEALDACRASSS